MFSFSRILVLYTFFHCLGLPSKYPFSLTCPVFFPFLLLFFIFPIFYQFLLFHFPFPFTLTTVLYIIFSLVFPPIPFTLSFLFHSFTLLLLSSLHTFLVQFTLLSFYIHFPCLATHIYLVLHLTLTQFSLSSHFPCLTYFVQLTLFTFSHLSCLPLLAQPLLTLTLNTLHSTLNGTLYRCS